MHKATLTAEQKEGISAQVMTAFKKSGFDSRARFANSIRITSTDFSNIENRKWKERDQLIGVDKWIRIARAVKYEFTAKQRWLIAPTVTYRLITRQLEMCKDEGMCAIFCDEAGIGKTATAIDFCEKHPNAFYINGGEFPRKLVFIRALAQAVGINPDKSTAEDTLEDVITYLKSLVNPIIIIDEAGDMHNNTYLLLKRIYNVLEFQCGIYMLGARGLKKRIDSAIRLRTNGFEEVFSRFGSRYTTALPAEVGKRGEFMRAEATLVASHNGFHDRERLNKVFNDQFDLRRIRRVVVTSRAAS